MARRGGGAGALVAALALAGLAGCSEAEPTPDPDDDIDRTTESPDSGGSPDSPGLRSGLAYLYAGAGPTEAAARTADCLAGALLARADAEALADAGLVDGAVGEEAPAHPQTAARDWFAAQSDCASRALPSDWVERPGPTDGPRRGR